MKKYLPEITDLQTKKDVNIAVISAYGGMICTIVKVSEIDDFVKNQERIFGRDYFFLLNRNL